MPDEMRTEAMEACVTAYDKYPHNNEHIARFLKVGLVVLDRMVGLFFKCILHLFTLYSHNFASSLTCFNHKSNACKTDLSL